MTPFEPMFVPCIYKRCALHTPKEGDFISYDLVLFLLTYGVDYDKNKKYIIDGIVVKSPFNVDVDDKEKDSLIVIKTKYSFDADLDSLCFASGKCVILDDGYILLELVYVDRLVVTS